MKANKARAEEGFEVSEDSGVLTKSQNFQGPERCVFMLSVGKPLERLRNGGEMIKFEF